MNTFNAQAYIDESGKYILDKNITVKSDNVEFDGARLTLGRDITANVTVGGISTGKEYKRNTTYVQIFSDMLNIDMYYHVNIRLIGHDSAGDESVYNNKYSMNRCVINVEFPKIPENDESGRKNTICFLTINDGETTNTYFTTSTRSTDITENSYPTYTTMDVKEYEYIDGKTSISDYETAELLSYMEYSNYADPIYYGYIPTSDNPNFDQCSIYLIKSENRTDLNKYNLRIGNKVEEGLDYFSANSYVNDIVNRADNVTCKFKNPTTNLVIPFVAIPRDKTIDGIYDKANGFKLSLDSHAVELYYPIQCIMSSNLTYTYTKDSTLYSIYFGDPIIPGESTKYEIISNKDSGITSGEPMDIYLNNKIFMSIDETKVTE